MVNGGAGAAIPLEAGGAAPPGRSRFLGIRGARLASTALLLPLAATHAAHLPAADPTAVQRVRPAEGPPVFGHRVVRQFPHDPEAFTQGLVFHQGFLYESTGLLGESTLRRVDLKTGRVLQQRRLLPVLFGEGAAVVGDRIVQLTWRAGIGFVYDRETFRLLREFRYAGEGWGLTFDGRWLVMSDGSDTLRFFDPETFAETRRLAVHAGGRPVDRLNELEWIRGEIWANLWTEDRIARIDPATGEVLSFVDLGGILAEGLRHPGSDVLNGIAWDPDNSRIFVTGKKWPRLFEIEVVEPQ